LPSFASPAATISSAYFDTPFAFSFASISAFSSSQGFFCARAGCASAATSIASMIRLMTASRGLVGG